ncbi:MAG: hypothetical protein NUV35_08660 [Syntrophomonadaceae bacterium]|nr:hypothetical protein [Syntrophomonadaceae bacterium]
MLEAAAQRPGRGWPAEDKEGRGVITKDMVIKDIVEKYPQTGRWRTASM